jgi:uncharacterized membrane protein YtjA (UPF0391 family)
VTSLLALLFSILLAPAPLGLDTRPFSSYASWYASIILPIILILYVLNIAVLLLAWKRPGYVNRVALVWAVLALITTVLDEGGVGGPMPGLTVGTVEILYLVSVLVTFWLSRAKPNQ